MKNNNKNNSTKPSIKVPIFYYSMPLSNGTEKRVYDYEAMADEFENELSKLDPNVVVMCSVENKEIKK
tara:strand:+ start:233 stop:436 length:204 start_codon:yes stop_codon:yes gene_type:complete